MKRHAGVDGGRLMRTRWAAIGAAVAVSLGGSGLFLANAADSTEGTTVTVNPERILDTRDPVNVGLSGPFVSAVSQKLKVTGAVPTSTGTQTVVPTGANGVLLNVTAVSPTANGFISIRPGNATGAPTTSSLNVSAGATVPNAVTVSLPQSGPNAGMIDITFDALGIAGPTTDVLIDVVGYTTDSKLSSLQAQIDNQSAIIESLLTGTAMVPEGETVIGFGTWNYSIIENDDTFGHAVYLPARERVALAHTEVNFAPHAAASDGDPTCVGTFTAPTAPIGKVCIYISASLNVDELQGFANIGLTGGVFLIQGSATTSLGNDFFVSFSWAYTAPFLPE